MAIKIFKITKLHPEGEWIDVSGVPELSDLQKKLTPGKQIEIDETDPDHPVISVIDGIKKTEVEELLEDKVSLLGEEAGSGEPYHFPYNVRDLKYEDNKISLTLDTITLDNKKQIVAYPKFVELPRFSKVFDVQQDDVSVLDPATGAANIVTSDLAKQLYVDQVKNDLQDQISALGGVIKVEVVETDPATPVNGTMYFIGTASPYTIKLYTNDKWYLMGSTSIDLSGYLKLTDVATSTETYDYLTGNIVQLLSDITNGHLISEGFARKHGIVECKVEPYDLSTHTYPQHVEVQNAEVEYYNPSTGDLTIADATNTVMVIATCPEIGTKYDISTSVTNGKATGDTKIAVGDTATVTVSPAIGYHLPNSITVTGAASYDYDRDTGIITLRNPYENVSVSVDCDITPLTFISNEDGSTLGYKVEDTYGKVEKNILISEDGENWTEWDGTAVTLNLGEKRYVRNTLNTLNKSVLNYFYFTMTGSFDADGMVTSMVNYAKLSEDCLCYLFKDCVSLKKAPLLLETELAKECYRGMFKGSGITEMPDLPVYDVIAEYAFLETFSKCESLTTLKKITANRVEHGGIDATFSYDTGLTNVPEDMLDVAEIEESGFSWMFGYCSNLINAPKLKITNVPNYGCVNMFALCTSLTQVPDLDFKTIGDNACYGMFQRTALTKAPRMLALESFTGNSAIAAMFYGCTNLKVNENGTGTKIFTCPDSTFADTTKDMFTNTAGTFTGTPTEGNTYNYYE